jgi:plasmid maintenance system antidote protein VapI
MAIALATAKDKPMQDAKAIGAAATLAHVTRTKSVNEKIAQQFARQLRAYVDDVYDGNQTRAAEGLGFTQGHLSALMRGERKPGLPILVQLKAKTGRSIDEWLGLATKAEASAEDRLAAAVAASVVQALKEQPGPDAPTRLLLPPRKGDK